MSVIHYQKKSRLATVNGGLWLYWTAATTLGELVGFTVPALVGPLAIAFGASDLSFFVTVITAGAFEGAILGSFQWIVLKHYFPKMSWAEWSLATALAAVFAYFAGLTPSSVGDISQLNWLVLALGALMLSLIFLFSMGFFQWLVLRRYLIGSAHWITANLIAWPLGVLIPVTGIMLVPDGSPTVVFVFVGIDCGFLMGLTVGAITGWVLVKIYQKQSGANL